MIAEALGLRLLGLAVVALLIALGIKWVADNVEVKPTKPEPKKKRK